MDFFVFAAEVFSIFPNNITAHAKQKFPPGIVIKYESMEYRAAVHHAALVLDLASKSKKYMRELFEPPDVR